MCFTFIFRIEKQYTIISSSATLTFVAWLKPPKINNNNMKLQHWMRMKLEHKLGLIFFFLIFFYR